MATKKKPARKTAKKAAKRTARTAARRPKRKKPETLRIRSAAPSFTVADVEKSLAWYRDVMGFVVSDRWEGAGKLMGVEMVAGGVVFMLAQDDWKRGRDRVKGEGFRLYCTTAQDVDALARQIQARGGRLDQEPRDEPWGARAFAVTDPDGFKITIARPEKLK
jgi:uncharacterized glyoxalase superfamily protein PhnB